MIIVKFDVCGENEIRGIPRKRIDMFKYDPKCDILEVKLESGAYHVFNCVKEIKIVEV